MTMLQQLNNSHNVSDWFKYLKYKYGSRFTQFYNINFNPSILRALSDEGFDFAKQSVDFYFMYARK